jgi:hypothetical protein
MARRPVVARDVADRAVDSMVAAAGAAIEAAKDGEEQCAFFWSKTTKTFSGF